MTRRVVTNPTAQDDQDAQGAGFTEHRDVHQLRVTLPLTQHSTIVTRAFRPKTTDADDWLYVNNQAFVDHPDQSAMTHEQLLAQMAEPWFDASGFLLHYRHDRLAGFCWTKRHEATAANPPMGEIYVIGVDPAFQGLGLGRELVLSGLESLSERGENVGMLYVDDTNVAAYSLYTSLGFTLHHVDRIYDQANQPTK